MEISLSIVGMHGSDNDKLSKKHFEAMYIIASGLLEQLKESNYPVSHLVADGTVHGNHVAVRLFLNQKSPNLTLFPNANWLIGKYSEGNINHYHQNFKISTNINSLSDIESAKFKGAKILPMFYEEERMSQIASSDFLLVMTSGVENEVYGEFATSIVKLYQQRVNKEGIFDKSFHYSLKNGELFVGCHVPKV